MRTTVFEFNEYHCILVNWGPVYSYLSLFMLTWKLTSSCQLPLCTLLYTLYANIYSNIQCSLSWVDLDSDLYRPVYLGIMRTTVSGYILRTTISGFNEDHCILVKWGPLAGYNEDHCIRVLWGALYLSIMRTLSWV